MKIIRTSRTFTPEEIYKLTKSPSVKKLSDLKGCDIAVHGFVQYNDVDSKGNEQNVISFDLGGEYYATNSATFIRGFLDLVDIYGDAIAYPLNVVIGTGTSKAGREYLKCDLA